MRAYLSLRPRPSGRDGLIHAFRLARVLSPGERPRATMDIPAHNSLPALATAQGISLMGTVEIAVPVIAAFIAGFAAGRVSGLRHMGS